jgi:hypothetical protein
MEAPSDADVLLGTYLLGVKLAGLELCGNRTYTHAGMLAWSTSVLRQSRAQRESDSDS